MKTFRFIRVKDLKRYKPKKESSQNPSQFFALDGNFLTACCWNFWSPVVGFKDMIVYIRSIASRIWLFSLSIP